MQLSGQIGRVLADAVNTDLDKGLGRDRAGAVPSESRQLDVLHNRTDDGILAVRRWGINIDFGRILEKRSIRMGLRLGNRRGSFHILFEVLTP